MKATDILMDEHRVIERVLTVLERVLRRIERGEQVRPGLFLDAADFIANFADGSHHNKEEGVLFGAMVDAGVPQEGPIAVMLSEHQQARGLTRTMREGAERWRDGDDEAKPQVKRAAREYAALLRQHIAKEDQILFPMAEQAIPVSEHERVLADFQNVEPDAERLATYEKYVALAESLERELEG